MKVCVIGGGSTYTPELVEGLALRQATLPIDELVLYDIDEERLAVVGALSGRILDRLGWTGKLRLTTHRTEAIDGAGFVVCQLRVGGQKARLVDETLPLGFGCIGQETTGPGGFAKALRTVPVVLDLARETAERGAPGAWFVNFTNPVGVVTQALLDEGHRAIGLCNVAIGIQREVASFFDVAPDRVGLDHVGLNHLTWERAVHVDGIDRLGELLDTAAEHFATHLDLPADILRTYGSLPSYYLRYYYLTNEVLAAQRGGGTRAEEVMAIEAELLELYRDPHLDTKPALLAQRGGAFYSEAAAQLMASLHAGTGDIQVVDVANAGAMPDMAADAVVECPARIDRDGAHPLPLGTLAPEIGGLVHQMKAYERITARAAMSGGRRLALQALMANPLAPDYPVAVNLLEALLTANRHHLGRFFPHDGAAMATGAP